MNQFYVPPDQIPGGVPQSEPTEIAALKMQNQRMREMLKLLEWCDVDHTAYAVTSGGNMSLHRCPICNHSREYFAGKHAGNCRLAALLKETT